MALVAIIPARQWSTGRPAKNREAWPALCETLALVQPDVTYLVTDDPLLASQTQAQVLWKPMGPTHTVAEAVVHALSHVPTQPDDLVVILQPSSPTLNRADYVRAAVGQLAMQPHLSSVVSVVPLPEEVGKACQIGPDGLLRPYHTPTWASSPDRRQDALRAYRRDGTVYAVRAPYATTGDLYGPACAPLLVSPRDSVTLD